MTKLQLKIPPPVYFLLFVGSMWLLAQHFPLLTLIPKPWNYSGILIASLTLLADLTSLWAFFKAHTTVNPLHPDKTRQLVTTGLYRYTRNPMYLGLLLILLGWAIYLGVLSPFLLLPVFVWLITYMQILPEEAILQSKFGQVYTDYQQRVARWL
jgi:protein-S-isoprenylcysteine O-methyltransferase Ste14